MKTQTIYIPTRVEDELPEKEGHYRIEGAMESAYWHNEGKHWNRKDSFNQPTHWLKPTEAFVFTPDELKQLLSDAFDKGEESNTSNGCSANLTDKLCYCKNSSQCCYKTYTTKEEYIETFFK